MVLTLWTLGLGAYTWYWLRQPLRMVQFPQPAPQDLSVRSQCGGRDPQVDDTRPLEGLLMLALRRVHGRLQRAQRTGNNGKTLKYYQGRSWTLSCVAHFPDSSSDERARMLEIFKQTMEEFSDDDESPTHGLGEDEMHAAVQAAKTAFCNVMELLQYERFEEMAPIVTMIGESMRSNLRPDSSSEEVMESLSEKARRYAGCEHCEASDPEFWAEVQYGPPGPPEQATEDESPSNEMEVCAWP